MPITFPSIRDSSPLNDEHAHLVIDELFVRLRARVLGEFVEERYKQLVSVGACTPFAQVYTYKNGSEDRSMYLRSAWFAYSYDINELRAALGTRTLLNMQKARAVRRSLARLIDQTLLGELHKANITKPVTPEIAEAIIPIEFEQLAPIWGIDPSTHAPALITWCHARIGGLAVYG